MSEYYINASDVRREAGFEGNTNLPDVSINEAIRFAQAQVNGAIGVAYTLPLASVPEIVRSVTLQMAVAYLLLGQYGVFDDSSTKNGEQRLARAREALNAITTGSDPLVGTDGLVIARTSGDVSSWPDSSTDNADLDVRGSRRFFRMRDEL